MRFKFKILDKGNVTDATNSTNPVGYLWITVKNPEGPAATHAHDAFWSSRDSLTQVLLGAELNNPKH